MVYTHLAAAIVAAALSGWLTWSAQDWRYGAKEAERLAQVAELARMNAKAADMAAASHESDKAKTKVQFRTIYQEVERIVEKPIFRNVCIDSDGLRVINTALAPKPAASQPAPAVPGPRWPSGWFRRNDTAMGTGND